MTFTNNEIGVAGDYCIRCSNCDFSEFTGNSTNGAEYGIRANDSYYLTIENNVIENYKEHGIYFQNSPYSKVNYNHLVWFIWLTGTKYGIYNDAGQRLCRGECDYVIELTMGQVLIVTGARVRDDSEVLGDTILWSGNAGGHAIHTHRSIITENYINSADDGHGQTMIVQLWF